MHLSPEIRQAIAYAEADAIAATKSASGSQTVGVTIISTSRELTVAETNNNVFQVPSTAGGDVSFTFPFAPVGHTWACLNESAHNMVVGGVVTIAAGKGAVIAMDGPSGAYPGGNLKRCSPDTTL